MVNRTFVPYATAKVAQYNSRSRSSQQNHTNYARRYDLMVLDKLERA